MQEKSENNFTKNSDFGKIVIQLLDAKGLTKKDLADRMGVTKQSVGAMLKTNSPGVKILERVASALDCEIENLLPSYNKAYSNKKLGTSLVEESSTIIGEYSKSKLVRLPYLSIPATASFIEMEDYVAAKANLNEVYEFTPEAGERYDNSKAMIIEVSGGSMEPKLYSGYKVLAVQKDIGDWQYLNPGIYAVMYHKTLTIKRVRKNDFLKGYLELYADNERYGMEVVKVEDIRSIWRIERIVSGRLD